MYKDSCGNITPCGNTAMADPQFDLEYCSLKQGYPHVYSCCQVTSAPLQSPDAGGFDASVNDGGSLGDAQPFDSGTPDASPPPDAGHDAGGGGIICQAYGPPTLDPAKSCVALGTPANAWCCVQ
jgi:hypothetical protein